MQLETGDFDAAAQSFRDASATLAAAHERVSGPLAAAAAVVPVVAQHRAAVADMSGVGAAGAATVADALDEIDLDALRPVEGASTSTRWPRCDGPLTRVRAALVELQRTAERRRGRRGSSTGRPYELDDFDGSVDEHLPGLDNALAAIEMAPQMLGADGPRTYLHAVHHALGVAGSRRVRRQLRRAHGRRRAAVAERVRAGPGPRRRGAGRGPRRPATTSSSAQYGRFGFDTDGAGLVGDSAFRNLAMTPALPVGRGDRRRPLRADHRPPGRRRDRHGSRRRRALCCTTPGRST